MNNANKDSKPYLQLLSFVDPALLTVVGSNQYRHVDVGPELTISPFSFDRWPMIT